MAQRCAVVQIGGAAGTGVLPCLSVYGTAGQGFIVREAGIFNTTTTACVYGLYRFSSTGTRGSGLTEVSYGLNYTPICTATGPHTVSPTVAANQTRIFRLPAVVGAGAVHTWYGEDDGIAVPAGAGNGVGFMVISGSGQVTDAYIVWDE